MGIDGISNPATSLASLHATSSAETRALGSSGECIDEQTAKDFESVLLHKVLQEMARTVDESELLGGTGNEQAKDMFWYYLAQDLAYQGGLGLWKQLSGRQQYAEAQQGKKVNT